MGWLIWRRWTSWRLLVVSQNEIMRWITVLRLLDSNRLIVLLNGLANIACEARNVLVPFDVLETCFLNSGDTFVVLVFSRRYYLLLLGRRNDYRWRESRLRLCLKNLFCLWLTLTTEAHKSECTAQKSSTFWFRISCLLRNLLWWFNLDLELGYWLFLTLNYLFWLSRSNFWKRIIFLIVSLGLVNFDCIERLKRLWRLNLHTKRRCYFTLVFSWVKIS